MKSINSLLALILMFVSITFLFTACVTQSKVEYLQVMDKNVNVFAESEFADYTLKPNDELFIRINSLDVGAADVFSSSGIQMYGGSSTISPYSASLFSYSVDKNGYLLLPIVGNIQVLDKTLSEVSMIIRDSLRNVLSQPMVSAKLVNRYISVLGEVRAPGHFAYAQEKLTVYDALSYAGDITDYGDRNTVILIRNENNENKRINLDLTNSTIMTSEFYNLRPNDILYVKPLKNKFWGMRQFPFSVIFSTITTGLLIYNVFR